MLPIPILLPLLLLALAATACHAAAANGASPHWQLAFFADGSNDCDAIDHVRKLPETAWLDAATQQQNPRPANRVLWIRLTPAAADLPVMVLVARSVLSATWVDWRDFNSKRQVSLRDPEVLRAHAPGFMVLELPTQASQPLLACLIAPIPTPYPISVSTPMELRAAEYSQLLRLGLVAGLVLAMAALAFAFYARLREPMFADYAVYSVAFLGYLLHQQEGLRWLLPDALVASHFAFALGSACAGLVALFGQRFAVAFTGIAEQAPRVSRCLHLLAVLCLLGVLIQVLGAQQDSHWLRQAGSTLLNIPMGVMIALIAPFVLRSAYRGHRGARMFAIGWTPLLGLQLIFIACLLGALNMRFAPPSGYLMAAGAFESLVLGWGLADRIHLFRLERDRARHQAGHDALTGALNRAALMPLLDVSAKGRRNSVLLFLDIDHFKQINDKHGHAMGDLILRRFTDCVGGCLRGNDQLGRYGGEEFVALLESTQLDEGLLAAKRIAASVAALRPQGIAFTVSIGAAERRNGESVEQWLGRADQALYRAKSLGRNRVEQAA